MPEVCKQRCNHLWHHQNNFLSLKEIPNFKIVQSSCMVLIYLIFFTALVYIGLSVYLSWVKRYYGKSKTSSHNLHRSRKKPSNLCIFCCACCDLLFHIMKMMCGHPLCGCCESDVTANRVRKKIVLVKLLHRHRFRLIHQIFLFNRRRMKTRN